jgi:hypothetical protein
MPPTPNRPDSADPIGSDQDDLLAAALVAGKTITTAARTVGIGERTARRRMQLPAFRQRLRELRARLIEDALTVVSGSMTEAAKAFKALLKHKDPWMRLAAARAIMATGDKLREGVDLAAEMAALRRELIEGNPDGNGDTTPGTGSTA